MNHPQYPKYPTEVKAQAINDTLRRFMNRQEATIKPADVIEPIPSIWRQYNVICIGW